MFIANVFYKYYLKKIICICHLQIIFELSYEKFNIFIIDQNGEVLIISSTFTV